MTGAARPRGGRRRATKTTRQRRACPVSLTLDELLGRSAWFTALDEATRRQVRADTTERAVAQGDTLGHHGDRQHAGFGVLEGLIKWVITARDGRTVTLGGPSVGSGFGEGMLIRDVPRPSDLIALRYSRVAQIPFDTFDWQSELKR
jgi:CRP/FNR family cyclic AMP-dependent transcriptional regulator